MKNTAVPIVCRPCSQRRCSLPVDAPEAVGGPGLGALLLAAPLLTLVALLGPPLPLGYQREHLPYSRLSN